MNFLLQIFYTFLKIGMFSFGGGLAMLPFINKEIVEKHHWISLSTFKDIIGIAQMTPGPIAINSATFVGFKIQGVLGSLFATLGVITFSFILVSIATHYIMKFKESKVLKAAMLGMRPAVIGLILSAFILLAKNSYSLQDKKSLIIGGLIGFLLFKTKLHPILIIFFSGILGIIFYGIIPTF
ncbi:chromate transporter [Clostridium aestuarii]|uniref:Chromate transporter n=1 Tax=Clostridium aestuarii TaxID=338193 RepID=A0ABT4CZA0_9CLOT|nr:chromate transporter [Clostridium aestuarii]MCY6484305.1 chromate transporter [Clostridium aestuarii]